MLKEIKNIHADEFIWRREVSFWKISGYTLYPNHINDSRNASIKYEISSVTIFSTYRMLPSLHKTESQLIWGLSKFHENPRHEEKF